MRLAHDVAEHIEAPAVRHADDDFLDAELAAALDDLLERRHHGFGAVEAEALGSRVLDVGEALERLRLDQLVEDRLLALDREGDVLVPAFDALLDPGLLLGRGNVHELDADLLAIGAPQDLENFAHRRRLEAQDLVDEDGSIEVGLGEAVGLGPQLRVRLALGQAQRIEVGGAMAHHAIGADQHQRADAVLGGAQRGGRVEFKSRDVGLGLQPAAHVLLDLAIVAGERTEQLAVAFDLLQRSRPRRSMAVSIGARGALLLLQAGEEVAPLVAHRAGVALVLRLHLLDVGGIGALQEGGAGEGFVLRLTGHVRFQALPIWLVAWCGQDCTQV